MFTLELFVGFPVDLLFAKELVKANPNVVSTFVQETGDYLCEYTHNNIRYLGKRAGKNITLAQLDLLEKNIYSLLKKIIPEFPYDETPLYLFPIERAPNV